MDLCGEIATDLPQKCIQFSSGMTQGGEEVDMEKLNFFENFIILIVNYC